MEISLDGKVALVTGASRGIGKAIAAAMAASGAKVMISSRKQDALEAAAAEMDGDVEVFAVNAGAEGAGERAVLATIERFGGLDVLVNNAATNPYYGPTLEVDEGRYDKTFQVNCEGPDLLEPGGVGACVQRAPGHDHQHRVGRRHQGRGMLGVYNVTKAALIHLTRQLASELGPDPRRRHRPRPGQDRLRPGAGRQLRRRAGRPPPTLRLGEPEDIANLATFLASDLAGWITGETYVIDGGAGVSGQL